MSGCAAALAPHPAAQPADAANGSRLFMDYTSQDLLYAGSAEAPLVLYEIFSARCPHCARYHTEILPTLLDRYASTGHMQFVLVDFPGDLNPEVHKAAYCVGLQRGAAAHWQFWHEFFLVHDRWWRNRHPVMAQLARQFQVDTDAFEQCLLYHATPWLTGPAYVGHQKRGPWEFVPVFRLEDRQGQVLHTWPGALPSLDSWQAALEPYMKKP